MTGPREIIDGVLAERTPDALSQEGRAVVRDAILAALDEAGLVVAPREPTEAMLREGTFRMRYLGPGGAYPRARGCWAGMLAATKESRS